MSTPPAWIFCNHRPVCCRPWYSDTMTTIHVTTTAALALCAPLLIVTSACETPGVAAAPHGKAHARPIAWAPPHLSTPLVCDGMTDDTHALNLAMAAASGGPCVQLPAGAVCRITGEARLQPDLCIEGHGSGLAKAALFFDGARARLAVYEDMAGIRIDGVALLGQGRGTLAAISVQARVDDLRLHDVYTHGTRPIDFGRRPLDDLSAYFAVTDSVFDGREMDGTPAHRSCLDPSYTTMTKISGNDFRYCGANNGDWGVYCHGGCVAHVVATNRIHRSFGGIKYWPGAADGSHNVLIADTSMHDMHGGGIVIGAMSQAVVDGYMYDGSAFAGKVQAGANQVLVAAGNSTSRSGGYGWQLEDGSEDVMLTDIIQRSTANIRYYAAILIGQAKRYRITDVISSGWRSFVSLDPGVLEPHDQVSITDSMVHDSGPGPCIEVRGYGNDDAPVTWLRVTGNTLDCGAGFPLDAGDREIRFARVQDNDFLGSTPRLRSTSMEHSILEGNRSYGVVQYDWPFPSSTIDRGTHFGAYGAGYCAAGYGPCPCPCPPATSCPPAPAYCPESRECCVL